MQQKILLSDCIFLHYPLWCKVASLGCNRTSRTSNSEGVSSRKASVAPPIPPTQTGGLLMIKDVSVFLHFLNTQNVVKAAVFFLHRFMQQEPWQGPPGLSPDDHLASAARLWREPNNKFQIHSPPNQVNIKVKEKTYLIFPYTDLFNLNVSSFSAAMFKRESKSSQQSFISVA